MRKSNPNPQDDRQEDGDDEEYGDFEGADIEDDAPEAVQALAGPSPWATFPDLLRVQSNSSSAIEDDPPESLSFASRIRPAMPSSSSGNNIISSSSGGSSNRQSSATHREMGAIPKQIRPLNPPDVSQISLSNSSAASSSISSPSGFSRGKLIDFSNGPLSSSRSSGAPSSSLNRVAVSSQPRNPDSDERNHQLERDVKALQTQKAVLQQQLAQKDNQIRELQGVQRVSNDTNSLPPQMIQQVMAISESVNRIQNSVETLAKEMDQKLNAIEKKVNSISLRSSSISLSGDGEASGSAIMGSGVDGIREDLRNYCDQQRKELENERRMYLLAISEVFKKTADAVNHSNLRNSNNGSLNGPHN